MSQGASPAARGHQRPLEHLGRHQHHFWSGAALGVLDDEHRATGRLFDQAGHTVASISHAQARDAHLRSRNLYPVSTLIVNGGGAVDSCIEVRSLCERERPSRELSFS